jgi:hypothetical protein
VSRKIRRHAPGTINDRAIVTRDKTAVRADSDWKSLIAVRIAFRDGSCERVSNENVSFCIGRDIRAAIAQKLRAAAIQIGSRRVSKSSQVFQITNTDLIR